MKKLLSLALLGATTSLFALYAEHASLYKDPRMMGMGGANIAVGKYSTAVFTNPAGLATLSKENGFVVDLLGLGLSASAEILSVLDDINNAQTDSEMVKVLEDNAGVNFHIGVDNYSSISKNSEIFAWSIGLLAGSDVNFMPHIDATLTSTSRAYAGVVLGAAKPYDTDYGRLDVGMSMKLITQKSYSGKLTATDLLGDTEDLVQTLRDKFEKDGTGFGVDVGVTYHPFDADNFWQPAIGMSVMNIGSMDMDDQYGGQPMTVNMGISISPQVPIIEHLIVALDYVDMLNANEYRIYNIDGVTYDTYEENDIMKRIRLGVSAGLIESTFFSTTLNVGMYQADWTAGINMELTFLKLDFATYAEQIGTGDTDISDRRYMARLGIGW